MNRPDDVPAAPEADADVPAQQVPAADVPAQQPTADVLTEAAPGTALPVDGGHLATACEAPSRTRSPAHTRHYHDGKLVAQGFPVSEISERRGDGSMLWLDLLEPTERDMEVLTEEFGLHPLATEDAMAEHQRPKLDRYRDHAFLAAYAVHATGDARLLVVGEVAAFLVHDALITVRKSPMVPLKPVLERWDSNPSLAACGVGFLVHGLLDVIVDGHTRAAASLDDEADAMEDAMFDTSASPDDLQRRAFALRKTLTALRRAVTPMRDVLATLSRPDMGVVDHRLAPYIRDVDDHVTRNIDHVAGLGDTLATILDVNATVASNRLNETIFRLTAYAALLTVTTAITGYFGQNVPFPGFGHPAGFYGSTVLLVGGVGGLYLMFKRRGWL